jgi:hypothetical protein
MGHKPCAFRKNDLVRALKAAQEAGMSLARIEIETDGRIVMVVGLAALEMENSDAGGNGKVS